MPEENSKRLAWESNRSARYFKVRLGSQSINGTHNNFHGTYRRLPIYENILLLRKPCCHTTAGRRFVIRYTFSLQRWWRLSILSVSTLNVRVDEREEITYNDELQNRVLEARYGWRNRQNRRAEAKERRLNKKSDYFIKGHVYGGEIVLRKTSR